MAQVCPLRKDKSTFDSSTVFQDCYEDRCAWWFKEEKRCSVPQIAREIERLADRVQDFNIDFRAQLETLNQNIFKG
jgi:hypothetical protein